MNHEEWNEGLEEIKEVELTEKEKELAKKYTEIEMDLEEIISFIQNDKEI